MNIVNRLTVRHLRQNKSRTLITLMGIMLSVAMVCAVAGFTMSLHDMLLRTIKENKGDWHIAYIDVTEETASAIADEAVFNQYYTQPGDTEGLVNVYLRLNRPGRDCQEVARGIAEKYHVAMWGGNTELLALEGVISQDHDNVMKTIAVIASVAIIIIIAGSVIVIANAFFISSSERVRQFGLLKSVGATKSQIGRSIVFEAFLLAVAAIPSGIALGFLIQVVVLWLTNGLLTDLSIMNNGAFSFRVVFNPLIIAFAVVIAAVTLLISAWIPARRAAKTSPIDAIRQTKDIRIRKRQLKTSPLTGRLFGFEGTLAAKSLKRSRGKYRATVISLTVSIVLFISVSSLVWVMNKGVEMQYGNFNFDVLVNVSGDMPLLDRVGESLNAIPNTEILRIQKMQRAMFHTSIDRSLFTERARARYEQQLATYYQTSDYMFLVSLPDEAFSRYAPVVTDAISGVLVNTSGAVYEGNKLVEYTPYHYTKGMTLALMDNDLTVLDTVTIAAETTAIPEEIAHSLFAGAVVNVLVAETVFKNIVETYNMGGTADIYTAFTVNVKDAEAFCAAAEEVLQPLSDNISIYNYTQMARLNRNLVLIIMLFGYGFIGMLSLIAITSVISTISTGMALRKQEFAMLYSAGMTPDGMNKMLNLESLLYGVKSLAIGLPIGVGLSYALYMALYGTMEFAYQLPSSAMLISAASVMLLTFGTMRYGKRKLNKISIVEALRSETA